jgi:hypothetical protein
MDLNARSPSFGRASLSSYCFYFRNWAQNKPVSLYSDAGCDLYRSSFRWSRRFCRQHSSLSSVQKGFSLP